MKVRRYEGINHQDFNEISRYLKQGYAVDFKCGIRGYGGNPENEKYRKYVDGWVEEIHSAKGGAPIRIHYQSPDNPECVRIFLLSNDKNSINNVSAKFLLSETY